ncbi:EpsG family protein [Vibrio sp. 1288]|uniref:EpsG family protein n=1 Tax=Vibrio sp. 1288 TaxID=3074550 RepID=UPI002965E3B1|nr:EpsG family protein [Vibrio sp. 1288]MDW3133488.1 EpsG family protein [Vibrio sp. 1288]
MIVYIFLLSLLFFLAPDCNKKTKFVSSCMFFAVSSLIMGMRGIHVGVDTEEYYWLYYLANNRPEHYFVNKLEPGFVFINKLFGLWFHDASIMLLFISLFVMFSFSYFVYKYSPSVMLAWLVFISSGQFFAFHNIARQSIAVAIILFSTKYILSRELVKFLLFVLMASAFHYSAIVFIPAYFVFNLRFNYSYILFAWIISFIFFIKKGLLLSFIDQLSSVVPSIYINLLHNEVLYSSSGGGIGVRGIFIQCSILLVIIAYKSMAKNYDQNKNNLLIVKLSLVSLVLSNVLYGFSVITRVLHYYTIFIPIAISITIFHLFRGKSRIIMALSFAAIYTMIFFRYLSTDTHHLFPYSSFLIN